MLTKDSVFELSRTTRAALYGDKGAVSRTLRRLLQREAPNGQVIQVFRGYDEAPSTQPRDAFAACAESVRQACLEDLPGFEATSRSFTQVDEAFDIVQNVFVLGIDYETASLAQLRDAVFTMMVLADHMHRFAADPDGEARKFTPAYAEEQALARAAREAESNARLMAYLGFD